MKLDEISDPNLKRRILEADRLQNPPRIRAVEAYKSQSASSATLDGPIAKRQSRQGCLVTCALVAFRKRLLDDDNNVASLKPLRDGIAKSLGIDDGSKFIRFEYEQVLTKGIEGVAVKIDTQTL